MYMRKTLLPAVLALFVLAVGCRQRGQTPAEEPATAAEDTVSVATDSLKKEEPMITFDQLDAEPLFDIVTNLGTIRVQLYKDTPKHRKNFAELALNGYYDSLLFHRVINGFMIQGGDPDSKGAPQGKHLGAGGPGYQVPAEFVPAYRHIKGALAAARRGDAANPMRESSGSQFYIVQNEQACAQLDGQYTVFGHTVSGMEVIDKIASVQTDPYDRPVRDVIILKVKPVLSEAK